MKYRKFNVEMHAAFVDNKKTSDTVNRRIVLEILANDEDLKQIIEIYIIHIYYINNLNESSKQKKKNSAKQQTNAVDVDDVDVAFSKNQNKLHNNLRQICRVL